MRKFYLTSMDPDETVKVVSAPQQNVKGTKAYGSINGVEVTAPTITVT